VADSNIKNNSFQKTTYSIKAEVVQIRRVAESAKEIIEKQKRIIKSLVGEFKIIVKEDKFDRLKEKIDNWSPEKLVTRNELKKML
ncbi:MAG: hypothetical protein KKF89_01785, partial [Nanoarchaeota archaeon]|nr:hypothetical protein [Nanoarchaeota archaeon]